MFGFHKRHKVVETDFVYDQAVIVDILFDGLTEIGSNADHEQVATLENEISKKLPLKAGIDGHEFGDGSCTIYVYGLSAEDIFAKIEPILTKSHFAKMDIDLQFGPPDDPNTVDKKFTLY